VTLRAPDVAHSSFNDYVTAIRRNDEELGRLFTAITNDQELAATTALFVLPEFGRDRDFNERRGLDHGDDSDELHQVATVAWGPDFRQGRVEDREVSSTDVAPTIASLFGTRTGPGTGSVLPGLFA
jgi:membrane-anchored protein YejM (alkaline phosphatase superfamily)